MKTKDFYRWVMSDGTFYSLIDHFLSELIEDKGLDIQTTDYFSSLSQFEDIFGSSVNVTTDQFDDIDDLYDTYDKVRETLKRFTVKDDFDDDTKDIFEEYSQPIDEGLNDIIEVCIQNRLRIISSDLLQPLVEGGVQ